MEELRGFRLRASSVLTLSRRRAARDGLSLVGLAILAQIVVSAAGNDARAYWAFSAADPYHGTVGSPDAFLYSPAAALAVLPLHQLPWPVFRLALLATSLASLAWMTRRWAFAWVVFVPVALDLASGNVHLLLAAAIVLGMRYPAAWSFVLLTKVTPGVGLLWYAVRREWGALATALGVTAALAATSALIVPSWWPQWLATLSQSSGARTGMVIFGLTVWLPLLPRLVVAAVLVSWGAFTDRRWTVPLAAMIGVPALWTMTLAMLVGVVPLRRASGVSQTSEAGEARPVAPPIAPSRGG